MYYVEKPVGPIDDHARRELATRHLRGPAGRDQSPEGVRTVASSKLSEPGRADVRQRREPKLTSTTASAVLPYVRALKSWDAGKIELERGEDPTTVKRLLRQASRETGIRVRSSWEDSRQRALFWKKTEVE